MSPATRIEKGYFFRKAVIISSKIRPKVTVFNYLCKVLLYKIHNKGGSVVHTNFTYVTNLPRKKSFTMEKKNILSILKHVGSILFFVAITFIFFLPQFQGKELRQGDQTQWKGMSQESVQYNETTGNDIAWCGSMFSGMPGYTVCIRHNYPNALNWIEAPIRAFDYHTASILLFSLICGYIFFVTLGCSLPIAILGAVAFAFSTYFPIIIEAGHVTKGWVMASIPLVLAGITLIFRKKWIV